VHYLSPHQESGIHCLLIYGIQLYLGNTAFHTSIGVSREGLRWVPLISNWIWKSIRIGKRKKMWEWETYKGKQKAELKNGKKIGEGK